MSAHDYLPRSDSKFLDWVISFMKHLASKVTLLHIPVKLYKQLEKEKNVFAEKFKLTERPATRTVVTVAGKNNARTKLEKNIRQIVAEYLSHSRLLTATDRDELGIPIRKTTRTPAPVAESYPDFDIDSSMISCLIIHFFEKDGTHKKAKPVGQHGVEIRWMISDVPMVDANEFIHSSFDTRTPFTLEFSGHDRGKTVYLALRWENTRGLKGHWSPIRSAIIP